MKKDTEKIEERTSAVGKFYDFDKQHDPRLPAQHWFQHSLEGHTCFVVFYTQACRWSRCLGCNFPSKMHLEHVSFNKIMKQIDFLFEYVLLTEDKIKLNKFIISNNGSVFDQKTFSTTALLYFLAKMNIECPNISIVTIETRPEYVDTAELEVLSRALEEGNTPTQIEIAIGFEAFDDNIRNDHFKKGLNLNVFEKMVEELSTFKHYKLKTYFMLKPIPDLTEEDAISDIMNAIDYLSSISAKYDIEINMHLNPTYAAVGTPLETAFKEGRFEPPYLKSVCKVIQSAKGKNISIFVGLFDEGLAVPGGNCIREGEDHLVEALEKFNQTQDFSLLPQ